MDLSPELQEKLDTIVTRARNDLDNLSSQPRFDPDAKSGASFGDFIDLSNKMTELDQKPYLPDSRARDQWLRKFWPMEPHLAGVLNSVVSIDKNRGWSLIGTEEQVDEYQDILHDSENGAGWRTFFSKESLAYYTSDMGSLTEVGRDGRNGPLASLYFVDPARCKLTGNPEIPLAYYPLRGKRQLWNDDDFLRVSSMPSTDEKFNGLGWCAESRAISFAQIMVAVFMHDKEELGARAAQGLLLLNNISEPQWNNAMKVRKKKLDAQEMQWYGGVAVIASAGIEQVDAKLVALSNLPKNFDRNAFINGLMFGYALIFGYDPAEFWPVNGGPFGRATEVKVQHQKATGKGSLEFVLGWQEQLQRCIPKTIHFSFEQRDDEGEMTKVAVQRAYTDLVTEVYKTGLKEGAPLVSRDEARSMLAWSNIIPRDWTDMVEDVEATASSGVLSPQKRQHIKQAERRKLRRELLENKNIFRAIRKFPSRPLVRYTWPNDKIQVIYERAGDAMRPVLWSGYSQKARQLGHINRQEVLFEGDDEFTTITEDDVQSAIDNAYSETFSEILEATEITQDEIDELELEVV